MGSCGLQGRVSREEPPPPLPHLIAQRLEGWGETGGEGQGATLQLSCPCCSERGGGILRSSALGGQRAHLSVASSPGRSVAAPSPASCQLRRQGRAPQSLTPAPPTCSDHTPGQQPAQTRGPAPSRQLERGAPRCLWAG